MRARPRRRTVDAMSQATLRTDRLELNSDPVVHRFLSHRGLTPEETRHQLHRALAAAAEVPGSVNGSAVTTVNRSDCGCCSRRTGRANCRFPARLTSAIGCHSATGARDYASEGARELIRHGFQDLGLTRIFAQTMTVNHPSRATMTSVGLTFVRTFAEEHDVPIPGHDQGEVEYDITRQR